jgi:hypothetical protein
MSWLSKIFGGKKEEVKTEAPVSAPEASEIPMSGEPKQETEMGGGEKAAEEETEEAGSEEMK